MKKSLFLVALSAGTIVLATADKNVTTAQNAANVKSSVSTKSNALAGKDVSKLNIRVLESYEAMGRCTPGQECGKDLEALRAKLSADLERHQQNMQQVMTELQAKAATMSEASRTAEEKKLRQMDADYKVKLQESELEMKTEMQKVTEGLAKEMKQAVAEFAENNKIDAVIDKSSGQVIYASNKLDITEDVIKQMDTLHTKKLAANKNKKSATAVADAGKSAKKAEKQA